MRHAKSSWDDPELADHDRPLNKRGKRDAPRMGRLLVKEELVPDAILTSTAVRARETAQAVAEALEFDAQLQVDKDLYLAGPAEILAVLRRVDEDAERALLIAHNPGLEELLEALTGSRDSLPTAAIARIDLAVRRWRDLKPGTTGRLVALWRPKEI
jgi:phosphohistidine phosphatase